MQFWVYTGFNWILMKLEALKCNKRLQPSTQDLNNSMFPDIESLLSRRKHSTPCLLFLIAAVLESPQLQIGSYSLRLIIVGR